MSRKSVAFLFGLFWLLKFFHPPDFSGAPFRHALQLSRGPRDWCPCSACAQCAGCLGSLTIPTRFTNDGTFGRICEDALSEF